jgi:hypothetical protein
VDGGGDLGMERGAGFGCAESIDRGGQVFASGGTVGSFEDVECMKSSLYWASVGADDAYPRHWMEACMALST